MKIINIFIILIILVFAYTYNIKKIIATQPLSIHDCIYDNPHKNIIINDFEINYLENSPKNCINPNFPSIHIVGKANYNAWLHLIYTDAKDPKRTINWCYIDADKNNYPFYTVEKDFYDAPLWGSSFFKRPLSYWKGHAWAVFVDFSQCTIQIVEGFEWGFEWKRFRKPKALTPRLLSLKDWNADFKQFETFLQYYKIEFQ